MNRVRIQISLECIDAESDPKTKIEMQVAWEIMLGSAGRILKSDMKRKSTQGYTVGFTMASWRGSILWEILV